MSQKKNIQTENDTKPCLFICHDCKYSFAVYINDDPTTSSGCCKACGANNWNIIDRNTKEKLI